MPVAEPPVGSTMVCPRESVVVTNPGLDEGVPDGGGPEEGDPDGNSPD